ncbi:MAG: hypothetical protein NUW06_06230 [Candidatus Acetothermia bacterium]|nr:hypothetical protein [Candidatus Acetothermia bacterium]
MQRGPRITGRRLPWGLVLGALLLGAVVGLEGGPALADLQTGEGISADYKDDLLTAAADLLELSWDLLSDLRTELFDPLKDVKDWKVEAQATLETCLRYESGPYQTCADKVGGLIRGAEEVKLESVYPGLQKVHETLSWLDEDVTSLAIALEGSTLDGEIGEATAYALAKKTICYDPEQDQTYFPSPGQGCLEGDTEHPYAPLLVILVFLMDKDIFLVEMDKLLEQGNEYESEALAWLDAVAGCDGNTTCERRAMKKALAALKKSLRAIRQTEKYLWQIKDNIKFIVAWLCGFQQLVIRAPVLELQGASLALTGSSRLASSRVELRAERAGGTIRFVALGPGIEALQLRVFDLGGRAVFDSPLVMGTTLEWALLDSRGRLLANGVYLYVLTVKLRDGALVSSGVEKLAVVR